MNKGVKVFLIVSLCILIAGAVLAGVGLSLVARRTGGDARRLAGEIARDVLTVQEAREGNAVIGGADEPTGIQVEQRAEAEAGFTKELSADFRELTVELRLADLLVCESEDGSCRLETRGLGSDDLTVTMDGDELRIVEKNRGSRPGIQIGSLHVGLDGILSSAYRVELYLSKELNLEDIELKLGAGETQVQLPLSAKEIELKLGAGEFSCLSLTAEEIELSHGAGEVRVEKIDCEELNMRCGAGEVRVQSLRAGKKARVECGMGEVTLKDARLNDAKLSIGLGEFSLEGELTGKCQVSQGAGETRLRLTNDPNDVFIRVDKGIGESRILAGGKSAGTSASGRLVFGKDTAPNRIEVSGGLGEFTLELP